MVTCVKSCILIIQSRVRIAVSEHIGWVPRYISNSDKSGGDTLYDFAHSDCKPLVIA